ncbi:MAG: aspartate-semialdehyde dehydrogenase [Betaproteobacteria bacterium]|nr:aspartate-semialdehyde dehydrogenase [Betaproteobacteria bacterium]
MKPLTLGIVGATGVVGQTALDILGDGSLALQIKEVRAFASVASVGKRLSWGTRAVIVEPTELDALAQCDAVLFASEAEISKRFIPELTARGILCVDKSSAFREDGDVPLVVPEVNGKLLNSAQLKKRPLVANPNCCTTPLVMVLDVLRREFGLKRVIVSTYQSVSGAGKPGLEVLEEEARQFFTAQDLSVKPSRAFPKSIAFNVMPFVAKILPNGDTDEEQKIIFETRKILDLPDLPVEATSVRVPTFVGHAESVTIETEKPVDLAKLETLIASSKGMMCVPNLNPETAAAASDADDAPDVAFFPTPRECQGRDEVLVGRLRTAKVFAHGVSLWLVSDNLRKGAALNALQVVEACAQDGFFN